MTGRARPDTPSVRSLNVIIRHTDRTQALSVRSSLALASGYETENARSGRIDWTLALSIRSRDTRHMSSLFEYYLPDLNGQ